MEVAIRIRAEEHGVPSLDRSRVDNAVNNGADVGHRIHLSDAVLEWLVGDELLSVALASWEEVQESAQLTVAS